MKNQQSLDAIANKHMNKIYKNKNDTLNYFLGISDPRVVAKKRTKK